MQSNLVVYCDGFMVSQKEKSAGGSYAFEYKGKLFPARKSYSVEFAFSRGLTNNEAEYFACFLALGAAQGVCNKFRAKKLLVLMDSELVVNQMEGIWIVGDKLEMWYRLCRKAVDALKEKLDVTVKFQWIARSKNVEVLGH